MRKLSLVIFLISATLDISCTTKPGQEVQILDLKDLIIDTLYLEKDSLTKNLGDNFSYYKTDSGEVLATFIHNKLLIYDFPKGLLQRVQYYETEGPNGIGSFISGHFIDVNSIYLLSQQKELIQCDFNGKVVNKWDLPEVSSDRKYANYSSMLFNKLQKSGNNLFFVDIPHVFLNGFETYDKWGIIFNTENFTFSNFHFTYPNSIKDFKDDDQLGLFSHVYNPRSNEYLIGFAISDSIAVVKNGKQAWKWAGTAESLAFKKGTTFPSGDYTVFQPNYESSKYEGLDLDTYSQKFLRWVKIRGATQENPDQQRYRLLIFDRELNQEAEIEFKRDELGLYGFNTPKGYAINSISQSTDDIVAFVLLDFSKIKP